MKALLATLLLPAVILIPTFMTSCGSSTSMTVTVTPTEASIPAGGSLDLTGTEEGFSSIWLVEWWVDESRIVNDINSGCWEVAPQFPLDFTGCPYGIVVYSSGSTVPSLATYYAPQTSGTYHVKVSMTQAINHASFTEFIEKKATATITVTP